MQKPFFVVPEIGFLRLYHFQPACSAHAQLHTANGLSKAFTLAGLLQITSL